MSGVIRQQRYDTATDPSQGRVRRLVASWLGLILLAFNILGAGAVPAQAEGSTPLFAQELLGDRIVVCTAAGMVVMDRDGNIIDTGDSSAHSNFCVFCLPLMHGVAKPAAMLSLVVDAAAETRRDIVPVLVSAPAKPALLRGASSPRAPPLS